MDLSSSKWKNSDKLSLCKTYFYLGFAFLPFLWLINAIWFFRESHCKTPTYPEQTEMKRIVTYCILGSLIWLFGLITWITIFAEYRASWGEIGDRMSFNIPIGRP